MKVADSKISNCIAGTSGTPTAPIGEGGAFYYNCKIMEDATVNPNKSGLLICDLDLKNIKLTSNTALHGGGIWWNYKEPSIAADLLLKKTSNDEVIKFGTLTFHKNKAFGYGPEIAGVTLRLI